MNSNLLIIVLTAQRCSFAKFILSSESDKISRKMNRRSAPVAGNGAYFIKLTCCLCGRSHHRPGTFYGSPDHYKVPTCTRCGIECEAIFVSKYSIENLFK